MCIRDRAGGGRRADLRTAVHNFLCTTRNCKQEDNIAGRSCWDAELGVEGNETPEAVVDLIGRRSEWIQISRLAAALRLTLPVRRVGFSCIIQVPWCGGLREGVKRNLGL